MRESVRRRLYASHPLADFSCHPYHLSNTDTHATDWHTEHNAGWPSTEQVCLAQRHMLICRSTKALMN